MIETPACNTCAHDFVPRIGDASYLTCGSCNRNYAEALRRDELAARRFMRQVGILARRAKGRGF